MKNIGKPSWLFNLTLFLLSASCYSQAPGGVGTEKGARPDTDRIVINDSSSIILKESKPLYSFVLKNDLYKAVEVRAIRINDHFNQTFEKKIIVTYTLSDRYTSGLKAEVLFDNKGNDTVSISNVVPFGEDTGSVYITGKGPDDIARAWLFRPGYQPLRVILPDNAWEMGYSSFSFGGGYSLCSVARRLLIEGRSEKTICDCCCLREQKSLIVYMQRS